MTRRSAGSPTTRLRALAEACIQQHIPEGHMDVLLAAEKSERQALRMIGQQLRDEEAEGDDGRA